MADCNCDELNQKLNSILQLLTELKNAGFVKKSELENLVSAIGFEVEIVGERVVTTD